MERREGLDSSAARESGLEKWEGLDSSAARESDREKWEGLDLSAPGEVGECGLECCKRVAGRSGRVYYQVLRDRRESGVA